VHVDARFAHVSAVTDYSGLLAFGGFTGKTPAPHLRIVAPEMSAFFLAQHLEVAHRHAPADVPPLFEQLCGRVVAWLPSLDVALDSQYADLLQRSMPDLAVAIAWAQRLDVPVLTAHARLVHVEAKLRDLRLLAC
jgi:hypothetical protein